MAKQKSDTVARKSLTRARIMWDQYVKSIEEIHSIAVLTDKNQIPKEELSVRMQNLETLLRKFHAEQDAILDALVELDSVAEFSKDSSTFEVIEKTYYDIQAIASRVLCSAHKEDSTTHVVRESSVCTLPKIDLPKFDGNLLNWCSFRDTFVSLVHKNQNIGNLEKFHYLLTCLTGPALTIVKSLPLSTANFDIAWEALTERYDNQRLLATAHLEKLFSFRPINSESLSSLLAFVNTFQENISAIKALNVVDLAGFILFFMGSRVLDPVTRHLFESSISQESIPTFDILLKFVQQRCKILENIKGTEKADSRFVKSKSTLASRSALTISKSNSSSAARQPATSEANPGFKNKKCPYCNQDHYIYRCLSFQQLDTGKKREFVSAKKLCFSCLSPSHIVVNCKSKYSCKTCGERHNTLLHLNADIKNSTPSSSSNHVSIRGHVDSSNQSQFAGTIRSQSTVLLGTAIVRVRDKNGTLQPARVLLDSGSQVSAITADCVARLGLDRRKCHTEIVGLAQSPVNKVRGATSCSFMPHHAVTPVITCEDLIILPRITAAMPTVPLPRGVRHKYQHLTLADPQFDIPAPVDMLIGGDIFPSIICSNGEIIHTKGFPSALETLLGWIFIGTVCNSEDRSLPLTSLSVSLAPSVDTLLRQFWSVEEPTQPAIPTTEDQMCDKWFTKTTVRDESGRFCVALPFRDVINMSSNKKPPRDNVAMDCYSQCHGLGDSRKNALKRLYNLELRLNKDPKLYEAYRKFMADYLALGHMKIATSPGKYFIPHHAVMKQDGDVSKLRVVFDASARSSSGTSLNDVLCVGPKLQIDISDVLLRCRLSKFVFTADIAKMYRQILVRPEDCAYQHIFWRHSPEDEVKEYELLTVTYGVSSAPYLAIRCLHELDSNSEPHFAAAKGILTNSTYVDDIIAGADSETELVRVYEHITGLLESAGCVLKKWVSNSSKLLDRIPLEDRAQRPSFDKEDMPSIKVLGLHWDPHSDAFGYHINCHDTKLTKRGVLSIIARLFDPIGTLGPMLLWAKSFMQQLWVDKLDWDTPLPSHLRAPWDQFMSELPALSHIVLPRHIDVSIYKDIQLLGFADASQVGYAATTFLRVTYVNEEIRVYFLTCKTKVAPMKCSSAPNQTLSIPRLELCAASLLAQLLQHLHTTLSSSVEISRIRAWSDSSIVLSWLKADQKVFKIFVTNRIAKIQALIPNCEWSHVSTSDNPADPSSRGLLPNTLVSCNIHWHGPNFIHLAENEWPISTFTSINVDQLPDIKVTKQTCLVSNSTPRIDTFLNRFSSLNRLQRATAYSLRFIYTRFFNEPCQRGPLSCSELNRAMRVLVRITQNMYFLSLFIQLSKPNNIITPPTVAQLAPFVDADGLIRVGGRLRHSLLSLDTKHPYLLPKSSHLTSLLISNHHLTYLHAGPKLVLSMLRQKYWIISGRDAVRRSIFACVTCTRHKAQHPRPMMGDLPKSRVQCHRPFLHVGMDYGGPFLVKESRRRNTKIVKIYLALFICMAVKAIHIEIVSDLTSDAFLAALDRFVARRGIPSDLYSDCGTNYVGAARQLKQLFNDEVVQNRMTNHISCNWHFNPPAAPHFGGLWEAAIKSVKFHLKHVIGTQILTYEEFLTLTVRVEGILNSRPLTPLSSDPHDLNALTPEHFLTGHPLNAIPDPEVLHIPINRLTRWELIRRCHQDFWKRWTREYLTTLQGRQKWVNQDANLKVNDLVIVEAPNCPPSVWRLGRIVDLHPGPDQVVRVVTVRTQDGIFKRPSVKLVKLPVDD